MLDRDTNTRRTGIPHTDTPPLIDRHQQAGCFHEVDSDDSSSVAVQHAVAFGGETFGVFVNASNQALRQGEGGVFSSCDVSGREWGKVGRVGLRLRLGLGISQYVCLW